MPYRRIVWITEDGSTERETVHCGVYLFLMLKLPGLMNNRVAYKDFSHEPPCWHRVDQSLDQTTRRRESEGSVYRGHRGRSTICQRESS